jgi:hypothetical protein
MLARTAEAASAVLGDRLLSDIAKDMAVRAVLSSV